MTNNISPLMQFAHDDAEIIKVHKLFEQAHLPVYATQQSACFDLRASLRQGDLINIFSRNHLPHTTSVTKDLSFSLNRGERCLVPTGLIFDLESNQSLRIHPRSGLAWKNAVTPKIFLHKISPLKRLIHWRHQCLHIGHHQLIAGVIAHRVLTRLIDK